MANDMLYGPQFNSPARRPFASLGVYGATQTQAVSVIKARLPDNFLEVRKHRFRGAEADCLGRFIDTQAEITSVLPHELVFVERTQTPADTNMDSFVVEHPPYGNIFLTGGIQVQAFSALNGLREQDYIDHKIVFMGVATSPQTFSNGITGFTVQTSGSVTIENLSGHTICAGDLIEWTWPETENDRPKFSVLGNPAGKMLANVKPYRYTDLRADANADGRFAPHIGSRIIGRALSSAAQCQNFDVLLYT